MTHSREELIASGVIRPNVGPVSYDPPDGKYPTLTIDDKGRAIASQRQQSQDVRRV